MIIHDQADITRAVLAEIERAPNARLREIMSALVRHLHDFVREVRLTEDEFRAACGHVAALGRHSSESHNEAVLMAGSLGLSTLVCLLNNGRHLPGERREPDEEGAGEERPGIETTANLLGPFWRADAPMMQDGASIVRSPTEGEELFVTARLRDPQDRPVAGAEVHVWHCSSEGLYENQDPAQTDMNLRGRFVSDAQGCIRFRTIRPRGYPIPVSGPVGDLLRALGRHNMRPAHVHFLIYKPGYKTHISQVYVGDDPYLDTDVQFGVTAPLVGNYRRHEQQEPAPACDVRGPWYSLDQVFRLEPGEARLPQPPITGKASGSRPDVTVLERRG